MIYELRSYWVAPGRVHELIDNAVRFAVPLQRKHGFDLQGFWTVEDQDVSAADAADVVYLLRWSSRTERDRAWSDFVADPQWRARQADTGAAGPLVIRETVQFLTPAAFAASP